VRSGSFALAAALALAPAGCRDRAAAPPRPADAGAALEPARVDVGAWLALDPYGLGCALERQLGQREPRFGCAAPREPAPADPCDEAWRDGPQLGPRSAARVHPLLRRVELSWEGGAVQRALFAFDPAAAGADVPRLLRIGPPLLAAAASHGPAACEDGPCWELVQFEAAEEDCEEAEEDE
jgi:hypothetical protein